jgi:hypothetical protein
LFSAGEVVGVDECVASLEARVLGETNASLTRNFTMMEVETALNQMLSRPLLKKIGETQTIEYTTNKKYLKRY